MTTTAQKHPSTMSTTLGLRRLLSRTLSTREGTAQPVLRIVLGAIMFPHGAQHLLGWFGGYGFAGTHTWMTQTLGFPSALAAAAIVIEFVAPLALIAGVGSRFAALGIIGVMIGAASTHLSSGFFMNWFGKLPAGSEGFEYHLLVIAIAAAIVIGGSGSISLDRWITRRESARP